FLILPPPSPPLFPYTTLFRSQLFPLRPGEASFAHVCHGETTSAAYADMYTRPFAETDTAGNNVSTRRGVAGAFSVLSSGCDTTRSEEHTSELQSRGHLVCRLL